MRWKYQNLVFWCEGQEGDKMLGGAEWVDRRSDGSRLLEVKENKPISGEAEPA